MENENKDELFEPIKLHLSQLVNDEGANRGLLKLVASDLTKIEEEYNALKESNTSNAEKLELAEVRLKGVGENVKALEDQLNQSKEEQAKLVDRETLENLRKQYSDKCVEIENKLTREKSDLEVNYKVQLENKSKELKEKEEEIARLEKSIENSDTLTTRVDLSIDKLAKKIDILNNNLMSNTEQHKLLTTNVETSNKQNKELMSKLKEYDEVVKTVVDDVEEVKNEQENVKIASEETTKAYKQTKEEVNNLDTDLKDVKEDVKEVRKIANQANAEVKQHTSFIKRLSSIFNIGE